MCWVLFFKQKTAYEMRISDWSSDVCSSDLPVPTKRMSLSVSVPSGVTNGRVCASMSSATLSHIAFHCRGVIVDVSFDPAVLCRMPALFPARTPYIEICQKTAYISDRRFAVQCLTEQILAHAERLRSEEHTSE